MPSTRSALSYLAVFSALISAGACSEDSGPIDTGLAGAGQATSGSGGKAAAGSGGALAGSAGTQASAGSGGRGGSGGKASAGSGGVAAGGTSGGSGAGGRAGAASMAGAAGKAGGGGSSGGGTSGGKGGNSSAGKGGGGGVDESGGAPGSGGGCTGDYILCEDFESTDVGEVPDGWTQHGDEAAVSGDDAHGGERALRLGPLPNKDERRIYHSAGELGSAHWGRVYYKVETPVPDAFAHSTMVSFLGDGPENGRSEFRTIDLIKQDKNTRDIGGRHNFAYNVQIIGGSEFNHETNYDYTFDGEWHCAEYHIQASNQSYAFYLDGESILDFENGPGEYDGSDIPDSFDEIRVGWVSYQNAPPGFTAWVDDIAFDDQRIGCE